MKIDASIHMKFRAFTWNGDNNDDDEDDDLIEYDFAINEFRLAD